LRDLLTAFGIPKNAKHVAFKGFDDATDSSISFVRSIPLEKALDFQTILATSMNGRSLTLEHGFPVRVLVPGWIGAASVKRVREIICLEREASGPYMEAYRADVASSSGLAMAQRGLATLTSLQVKSFITRVMSHRGNSGPITVEGAAWAGEAAVAKVEVSLDSGKTWNPAYLRPHGSKYAWTFWNYSCPVQATSECRASVRATDTQGRTQPEKPNWNPRGYLWNGYDHRTFSFME
jgi:sulfite oxidase